MAHENEALTVAQLIKALQQLPKEQHNLPVHFVWAYGDRTATEVAQGVTDVEPASVSYSEYVSDFIIAREGDDDEVYDVIVLR